MNYKIAITGHTRGIGQAIFKTFKNHGHDILGFSSSQGYNIGNLEVRQSILEQCKDCDIFINNAYDPDGQTELLKMFIENWDGLNKMIINISSKLVFYPGPTNAFFDRYISDKKEQNLICSKRTYTDNPKILNIMPGLVETEMSKIFSAPKISCDDLANYLYDIVKYKDIVSTQQIIVDVPGLNWADVKIQNFEK